MPLKRVGVQDRALKKKSGHPAHWAYEEDYRRSGCRVRCQSPKDLLLALSPYYSTKKFNGPLCWSVNAISAHDSL